MLIALAGLPAAGKTTIARALAVALDGVHLRIDSIEQVLRKAGWTVEGEGYEIAYAVAEDNLRLGRIVIADSVNPWPLTRAAWREVAARACVRAIDVEIICSDVETHRRRVESRTSDVPGLELPTWQDVVARDYRPWDTPRLVVDTAFLSVDQAIAAVVSAAQ